MAETVKLRRQPKPPDPICVEFSQVVSEWYRKMVDAGAYGAAKLLRESLDKLGWERAGIPGALSNKPTHNWGGCPRFCVHCGKKGARTIVLGGYAHRRCIPRS